MYVGKTRHTPDIDTVICSNPVTSGIPGDRLELNPVHIRLYVNANSKHRARRWLTPLKHLSEQTLTGYSPYENWEPLWAPPKAHRPACTLPERTGASSPFGVPVCGRARCGSAARPPGHGGTACKHRHTGLAREAALQPRGNKAPGVLHSAKPQAHSSTLGSDRDRGQQVTVRTELCFQAVAVHDPRAGALSAAALYTWLGKKTNI